MKVRRPLPWRSERSPYATLVAEVMLQQTQAAVVIPYFERWLKRFPTVVDLAWADEATVLKHWEGLGYYSRAKNLHAAAKKITEEFGGEFPDSEEALRSIRGIGPYTVGALLSFAFQKRIPAIDGNVTRVISRLFQIEEDVGKTSVKASIEQHAYALLPDEEPYLVAESLIELGALVCKKRPLCSSCPLQNACLAHKHGVEHTLPMKRKAPPIKQLTRLVAVIQRGDELLLFSEKERRVMQGLYQFPYLEKGDMPAKEAFETHTGLKLTLAGVLDEVVHSFTRYRVTLLPFLFHTEEERAPKSLVWQKLDAIERLTFSSGHRQILKQWVEYETATA